NDAVIVGYFKWVAKALKGDFGMSFQFDAPVMEVIGDNMWISFTLTLIALLLYYPLGIFLGIRAAVKQYSIFDYTTTVISMLGISLPGFFFAAVLIKVFAFDLGWFDTSLGLISSGMLNATPWEMFWDKAWHLVLPMITVVVLSIGGLMRYTRTNMLEVLTADYIRTARAKGVSENSVIYKHAFKNTMIPLVTMLAGLLPGLFGGSMIIEQVFAIPGIGLKAYQALNAGDIPFVMGYNMFLAVLTVLGMLITDIMYVVVDPRVKLK
ncbi:MAG: ABC transporter permease, partial [Clostridia bacterium]|nr:ABC transporter permease [Clostridia bacterium]